MELQKRNDLKTLERGIERCKKNIGIFQEAMIKEIKELGLLEELKRVEEERLKTEGS